MGWDAFGLPTENYAIKVGKTPQEVALSNIANFKHQVQMFGLSYDWDREINTSSPLYYRFTQWLFLEWWKKGMVYRKRATVNWCPKDQTVLANEQVVNGLCERCGETVTQKEMEQWFVKITAYAERLAKELEGLDWPSATRKRQEDWIGRSEGHEIDFPIVGRDASLTVFTTRADTLFGATYLVLAPEHPLVSELLSSVENREAVEAYILSTTKKTELMRQETTREKTGVPLSGVMALNPATGKPIPFWIADYVLGSYGTGAIMAVPAHDTRDFAFAKGFDLPIISVVSGDADLPFVGEGTLIHSGSFDGMSSALARDAIAKHVGGRVKVQYRIRDWSVSRQRYWGVPIPMIHCGVCGIVPVPETDLPVLLPEDVDFRPQGMPPLASSKSFIHVTCPTCGGKASRDPETLDTFVDSSWYYLRYTDPRNTAVFASPEKLARWMPVELYVIGAEHTTLHLLYARFVTKFLQDAGYLSFGEPFLKLRHQGLIMGADGMKMSKSKGNVVNPDDVIARYGADAFRMYEMFMGPFDASQPWSDESIAGVSRFLSRLASWAFGASDAYSRGVSGDASLTLLVHRLAKKMEDDILAFKFNTAVSACMVFLNTVEKQIPTASDLGLVARIMNPFVPHLAQEIWERLGHTTFLDKESWPEYDPSFLEDDVVTVIIQVNGKSRDMIQVGRGLSEAEVTREALAREKVQVHLGGKAIRRTIYVAEKLINFVL
jgi:leucyl-tRNA synthetase